MESVLSVVAPVASSCPAAATTSDSLLALQPPEPSASVSSALLARYPDSVKTKVLYSFDGAGEGRIPVQAGEIVTMLKLAAGGWSLVLDHAGKKGYVPSKFLSTI